MGRKGGYPPQEWGTPHHPDQAGVPPTPGMGYPPPSRPGRGTSHPRNGVPPTIQTWLGYPHHLDLAGVPPTIQTWPGYPPGMGTPHHPDLFGVPPHPRDGVPPTIQTWLGYPPTPGNGVPPHQPDLAGVPPHHPHLAGVSPRNGVPPTIQTWLGYPPGMGYPYRVATLQSRQNSLCFPCDFPVLLTFSLCFLASKYNIYSTTTIYRDNS